MAISDIPIFAMLRTRMQWHQQRQQVLAQNVANADTPSFRPLDLAEPKFEPGAPGLAPLRLARSDPGHLAGFGGGGHASSTHTQLHLRPALNTGTLADEM